MALKRARDGTPAQHSLKYAQKAKYQTLVDKLREASQRANCGSVKARDLSQCFKQDGGIAELDAYLHLSNWRTRNNPNAQRPVRQETVHVLVRALEQIRCMDGVLIKSTVLVDYYAMTGDGKAQFIQGLHFDFDGEKDRHPLFHVQFRREPIEIDEKMREELDFTFEIESDGVRVFKGSRIPTSDMTLASVLLCIAADHLDRQFFCEFREQALALEREMPRPVMTSLLESLRKAPDHFRSSHWFAHMK